MIDRFLQLPQSLAQRSRVVRLAEDLVVNPDGSRGIPALLCHPDWVSPAPFVLWMHGRTAYKELDSGRYSRLLRAGIAAVAIDLPGHGQRRDGRADEGVHTLEVMEQALPEVDRVLEVLADPIWQGVFDLDRVALGGMSLGGMITLRRLCDPNTFVCASVESSSGDLWSLYDQTIGTRPWGISYPAERVAPLDPSQHLAGFRPLPLLALHSRADEIVPWRVQQGFLERLRTRYAEIGADPDLVQSRTWESTGAPQEHSGFGRVASEAKTVQNDFLAATLRPGRV